MECEYVGWNLRLFSVARLEVQELDSQSITAAPKQLRNRRIAIVSICAYAPDEVAGGGTLLFNHVELGEEHARTL